MTMDELLPTPAPAPARPPTPPSGGRPALDARPTLAKLFRMSKKALGGGAETPPSARPRGATWAAS